jgi:hypothetical protein
MACSSAKGWQREKRSTREAGLNIGEGGGSRKGKGWQKGGGREGHRKGKGKGATGGRGGGGVT